MEREEIMEKMKEKREESRWGKAGPKSKKRRHNDWIQCNFTLPVSTLVGYSKIVKVHRFTGQGGMITFPKGFAGKEFQVIMIPLENVQPIKKVVI